MPLRARQTSRNKTLSHLRGEKTSVICSGFYTRRVKEAIHIRLHPDYINRDNGIKVPEAWMPKIEKNTTTGDPCDSGPPREQITKVNSKDRNAPIRAVEKKKQQQPFTAEHHVL